MHNEWIWTWAFLSKSFLTSLKLANTILSHYKFFKTCIINDYWAFKWFSVLIHCMNQDAIRHGPPYHFCVLIDSLSHFLLGALFLLVVRNFLFVGAERFRKGRVSKMSSMSSHIFSCYKKGTCVYFLSRTHVDVDRMCIFTGTETHHFPQQKKRKKSVGNKHISSFF